MFWQTIRANPGWTLALIILWALSAWWVIWMSKQDGTTGDGKEVGIFLAIVITMLLSMVIGNTMKDPYAKFRSSTRRPAPPRNNNQPQGPTYRGGMQRI